MFIFSYLNIAIGLTAHNVTEQTQGWVASDTPLANGPTVVLQGSPPTPYWVRLARHQGTISLSARDW